MTDMGQHSAAESSQVTSTEHRDHLWVVFVIAACCLLEVWVSWVTIGSLSGFPAIGGPHGMPTDWTLAVTTEAYWGYALYTWLAAAPGPRSRAFAMWSAGVVFLLSLTGQGAAHLLKPGQQPSPVLVVFVTSLPVVTLAMIAILVHMRQTDREEARAHAQAAARAERKRAEAEAAADERTALRAKVTELAERIAAEAQAAETREAEAARALQDAASAAEARLNAELDRAAAIRETDLTALRDHMAGALRAERNAREEADTALAAARTQLEKATAKAEALDRKLAAATGPAKSGSGTRKSAGSPAGTSAPARPEVPALNPDDLPGNWDELDTEARVLTLMDAGYSASKAGVAAGVTDARGRQIARMARDLARTAPQDVVTDEDAPS